MLKKVEAVIASTGAKRVTVALSGGADSMCLLHILIRLREANGPEVRAVHINHMIRGLEADRDENFVKDYCEKYAVPIEIYHINIPEISKRENISLELCGRNERYKLFAKFLNDGIVATAHNLTDCEETFLFNLSRGTGLRGLTGIPEFKAGYVRPLLSFTKAEILEYCEENGVPFVSDSTNLSEEYSRNYLRLKVLPLLRQANPAFDRNFLRAMTLLNDDCDYIDSIVTSLLDERRAEGYFYTAGLSAENPAIRSRFVHSAVSELSCGDAEYVHINYITEHLDEGCTVTLPKGDIIEVQNGKLYKRQHSCIDIYPTNPINAEFFSENLFGEYKIKLSVTADRPTFPLPHGVYALDCDKIQSLTIRKRQSGDQIRVAGRNGTKTVRKLMNELKIPASHREIYPVLATDDGVVLLHGAGPEEKYKITSDTKKFLMIEFTEVHNV